MLRLLHHLNCFNSMNIEQMKSALYRIVARCHVADSDRKVLEYAVSRIKPTSWRQMQLSKKVVFARACKELHKDNKALYRAVMR